MSVIFQGCWHPPSCDYLYTFKNVCLLVITQQGEVFLNGQLCSGRIQSCNNKINKQVLFQEITGVRTRVCMMDVLAAPSIRSQSLCRSCIGQASHSLIWVLELCSAAAVLKACFRVSITSSTWEEDNRPTITPQYNATCSTQTLTTLAYPFHLLNANFIQIKQKEIYIWNKLWNFRHKMFYTLVWINSKLHTTML